MDGVTITVTDPAAQPAPGAAPSPVTATKNGVTIINERLASVVDAKGRTLKVRPLTALDRMRLYKLVGPDGAANDRYFAYVVLAASVVEMDGRALGMPLGLVMLDAHVQLLDEEGIAAAAKALGALAPADEGGVAEAAKGF